MLTRDSGRDLKVSGYPGKAYGPARAKQLARMDLGGPSATSINVDNYVFYAISWYMYKKWSIIPKLPNYAWPRLSAEEGYPDDSSPSDADDNDPDIVIANGPILDDATFYAGSGYTPPGGNRPAGPAGPQTYTETIPMAGTNTVLLPSPTSTQAPPPASTSVPPAPPPYATGTCSFHLTETQICAPDDKNLFATITLLDNSKTTIGSVTAGGAQPNGAPINVADNFQFLSKLPHPIVIVGEHQNDYIQFTYGGLQWTSKTPGGGARCNNGGWDPRQGPSCGGRAGTVFAHNNMDCFFPC